MVVEAVGMIFASTFDLSLCAWLRHGRQAGSRLPFPPPDILPALFRAVLRRRTRSEPSFAIMGDVMFSTCSTFGSTGACRGPMRENEKGRATP